MVFGKVVSLVLGVIGFRFGDGVRVEEDLLYVDVGAL